MQLITTCEVCDGAELIEVLDLGDQPMCDDLVPIGNDAIPKNYPLRLVACPTCFTVHQAVQVEKSLLFPMNYHYRAAMTQDVLDGMRELVETALEIVGDLHGKRVLDIGCNDGSLLSIFKEQGAIVAGIEPTGAAEDARPKVDFLINGFFDSASVDEYLAENPQPDIITFTNVFAHIEDLNGVLGNVRRLMKSDTKLIVENHYLGSVVARNQFDTFYHEHPRTYSARSFDYIARKLGRNIESMEFPPRYNGNIRVVMGDGPAAAKPDIDETGFIDALIAMRETITTSRERVRAQLLGFVEQYGKLPAKAFPGRTAILIHNFGIDESIIDVAYERTGSAKIGHYVPGTRIEIRDEAEFFADRMDSPLMVNLAWHIHDEIERFMRGRGYAGQLFPIFQ